MRVARVAFLAAAVLLMPQGIGGSAAAAEDDAGKWTFTPSFNDYGTTGLVQMPNGRMAEDGAFTLGFSRAEPYTRMFLTSQFLPWLQATFRYTDIGYAPYLGFDTQSYKDKSVDVKIQLLEESEFFPEVSLGFRDIGGTGLFSSEYIAASRRYYDWDFTLGVAWGNMGSRGHLPNPLGFLSEGFKQRDLRGSETGVLNNFFFRGENIGLFGGIEWNPPVDGLRLKVEYDGNNYQREFRYESLEVDSPINVEVGYQPFPWLDLALGFERGNTLMFRGQLVSNFQTDMGVPKFDELPPLPLDAAQRASSDGVGSAPVEDTTLDAAVIQASVDTVFETFESNGLEVTSLDLVPPVVTVALAEGSNERPDALARAGLAIAQMPTLSGVERIIFRSADGGTVTTLETSRLLQRAALRIRDLPEEEPTAAPRDDTAERVFKALDYYGFTGERFALSDGRAIVAYSQGQYRNVAKAFGRAARSVALATPATVHEIELIEMFSGLPVARAVFKRDDVVGAATNSGSVDEMWMGMTMLPSTMPDDVTWTYAPGLYPDYSWGLSPQLRQSIGGPDNFYLFQVYGELNGTLRPAPGLSLSGSLGFNLYNNFDDFTFDAPSGLPRVRSDIRKYLVGTDVWLENLEASYVFNFAPDWYGRASAGLFEMMYGGVGGEVLYRPTGERWAVGLDLNHVWQRDFDGGIKFRDYNITTGHLTWYQDLPFYDLEASVSVGRYLAGDVGVSVGLGRTFDNGVSIGAWASKTNVSAEQFGEGSFDKGFYVTIPFDLFSTSPTRSGATFGFRPLIRDGGQKVTTPNPLYGLTRGDDSVITGWRNGMD